MPQYTKIVQNRTIYEVSPLMLYSADINYFDASAATEKIYNKFLSPICKEQNLTRNELDILLFLYNNPAYDRAADIVSRRGIAKSHVSLGVASLEEKGLLLRRFDENDRRTAHLELTESARGIAAQARETQQQFFAVLYRGISPEEFEIWRNIVHKVCKNIENFEITP